MRCLFTLLPLLGAAVLIGCQRPSATGSNDESGGGAVVTVAASPAAAQGSGTRDDLPPPRAGVGRVMQLAEVQNYLRQVGIAYTNFATLNGRGPRDLDELAPEVQNHPKIVEPIKKGWWIVIYNAQPTANAVLAYEAQPDQHGRRVVVMGTGNVQMMDEAAFKNAPTAR